MPELDVDAVLANFVAEPIDQHLVRWRGELAEPHRSAEPITALEQGDAMAALRSNARCFEAARTAPNNDDMNGPCGECNLLGCSDLMAKRRVHRASGWCVEEVLLDAYVTVDARANRCALALGEFVDEFGIGELLTAERHEVALASSKHFFGDLRQQSANSNHWNSHSAFHGGRHLAVLANLGRKWAKGEVAKRIHGVGRYMNGVGPSRLGEAGRGRGFFGSDTAGNSVFAAVEAHDDGEVDADPCTNRANHFDK